VEDVVAEIAEFRAYEVAISIANHILLMGFQAQAHDTRHGTVDLERLTVMAALGACGGKSEKHRLLARHRRRDIRPGAMAAEKQADPSQQVRHGNRGSRRQADYFDHR
jgi:hypothetical protein